MFVNKNWSNDPRVGYKSPSNLVKLIEKYLNLEEIFKKITNSFSKKETMNI
jgi:hypothetical protein